MSTIPMILSSFECASWPTYRGVAACTQMVGRSAAARECHWAAREYQWWPMSINGGTGVRDHLPSGIICPPAVRSPTSPLAVPTSPPDQHASHTQNPPFQTEHASPTLHSPRSPPCRPRLASHRTKPPQQGRRVPFVERERRAAGGSLSVRSAWCCSPVKAVPDLVVVGSGQPGNGLSVF